MKRVVLMLGLVAVSVLVGRAIGPDVARYIKMSRM